MQRSRKQNSFGKFVEGANTVQGWRTAGIAQVGNLYWIVDSCGHNTQRWIIGWFTKHEISLGRLSSVSENEFFTKSHKKDFLMKTFSSDGRPRRISIWQNAAVSRTECLTLMQSICLVIWLIGGCRCRRNCFSLIVVFVCVFISAQIQLSTHGRDAARRRQFLRFPQFHRFAEKFSCLFIPFSLTRACVCFRVFHSFIIAPKRKIYFPKIFFFSVLNSQIAHFNLFNSLGFFIISKDLWDFPFALHKWKFYIKVLNFSHFPRRAHETIFINSLGTIICNWNKNRENFPTRSLKCEETENEQE